MRREAPPLDRSRLRRVLVRLPNWLGDTVMALPAVRALRRALPGAHLTCLGPWAVPILEAEPGIDRCGTWPRGWRAQAALLRRLRAERIDLAVLFPGSFTAALAAWLAGARWRLGYREDGRGALLTHALPPPGRIHQAAAYLALLEPLGVEAVPATPTLEILRARREEARRLLAEVGVAPGHRAVGIQLGAAFGPAKLWPPERLGAVAAALERDGTPAVFLGTADARPLLDRAAKVLAGTPRSLVGRDHPALLPALLAELAVLVAPDSGPAHLAAAVGVPVVALFGPTDPRLTAPAGPRHAVLWPRPPCAPCFLRRCPIDHRCLGAIPVGAVVAAVQTRLGPSAGAPRP